MIPLNFGLWWSGAKLSYLRYLTFKSLRYFHPHSRIQLFTCKQFSKENSGISDQEFLLPCHITKDYTPMLRELGVEVVNVNNLAFLSKLLPYQQADAYRWFFLRDQGGIYLDPDQIILKSFKGLPLNKYKFIFTLYLYHLE